MTATVSGRPPRGDPGDARARVAEPRKDGKVSREADAAIRVPFTLPGVLVTVLPERAARGTGRNSGLPPPRTERDGTARRGGRDSGRGAKPNPETGGSLRRTAVGETVAVEACGAGLSGVGPVGRARRVPHGTVFGAGGRRVDAGARECPGRRARTGGRFPDGMPGPLRCGAGLQAFTVNPPVARMLPLRRAVAPGQAVSGPGLSGATCPGRVRRLDGAPMPWEAAAVAHLPERPAPHAGGTGLRVGGGTEWLHVLTDGSLALKFPHRRRGREAADGTGIVPRHRGVPVHDCRAGHFVHDRCRHRPGGAHLLREPASAVGSSGFRRARLMKGLPRGACHRISGSDARVLAGAGCRRIRGRCRTILAQGAREMPGIPPRPKGKRGRAAKSDARSLHGRPVRHGESVPRFMGDPDASFTDNAGERRTRMAKARMKVSGCFRTRTHAGARCRIPGHPGPMAAPGYNPPAAIQIALAGKAAGMTRLHHAEPAPKKG